MWERFIPFPGFPPQLRRFIYTTASIESLNHQLRKIIKNRGHFPNDQAVTKLLWFAICNIEDKRAREGAKDRGKPAAERKALGRLVGADNDELKTGSVPARDRSLAPKRTDVITSSGADRIFIPRGGGESRRERLTQKT